MKCFYHDDMDDGLKDAIKEELRDELKVLEERKKGIIKIIINVEDIETLENYNDVDPELIIDDFISNPQAWIIKSEIICVNS